MEILIDETYKGLIVLKALMLGLDVEVQGIFYSFDSEVRQIGMIHFYEGKKLISFPNIDLNRFIYTCEQISNDDFAKILASIQNFSLDKLDNKEELPKKWN